MRWLLLYVIVLFYVPVYGQDIPDYNPESMTLGELLDLSDKYTFNDPEKARLYADEALTRARASSNDTAIVQGLYKLGELNMRRGNAGAAKPQFEEALAKSRELADSPLMAEGFYHLSRVNESENNFNSAISFLQDALDLYESLGSDSHIARCYSSFGRIYQEIGSYSKALDHFFKSLRINEKLNRKLGISITKSNIGNVYLITGRLEQAIAYFSEALEIDRENNDKEGILINTLNIGVARQKQGYYDNALEAYRSALPIAKELEYLQDEALLLQNIGSTLQQQGNLEQALDYLYASLAIKNENNYDKAHTLNDISETYLDLNNFIQAKAYAGEAVEAARKSSDLNQLMEAYLLLSKVHESQGDFKSAYAAIIRFNSTKDSLFSLEKQRQMDELEINYETEKKEQEIELLTLKTQNAEFRRNAYLASGVLMSLVLLLLYFGQRQKNKKNRLLLEKEQEVAEMKSNFFSNISHEFRTPLTLISGPIEMLKEKVTHTQMKTQLEVMEKNADRLLILINQLLDLSRLESDKLELKLESTNIPTLVRGVAMSFQSLAEMKGIELTVETGLSTLQMDVDREKIETILINLINNAIAYTKKGGQVTVSLAFNEDASGKLLCEIRVKDTGAGIAEEDLPNVFDRFYRGDEERNPVDTGSGIGLALTKELVELHGGSIVVHSKVDEGTEFLVRIPGENLGFEKSKRERIVVSEPIAGAKDEAPVSSDPIPSEGSITHQTSEPILLLIEDNKDVTNYLRDILEGQYRILEAVDGEEGVETAFEYIPDLIISDVMMPKMNGFRVAETLKQDQRTSHIPLILLTAKSGQEDKMLGLRAHADEYVTKPFKPEELKVRIRNLIASRNKLKEKYKREFMVKPEELEVHSMDEAFLVRVKKVVEGHLGEEEFTVEQLGREVGMSRSQLHRKLTALVDTSASEFIRSYRLHRARNLILQEYGTIAEIAYHVGFGSPSYFSKCFREEFGVSPSKVQDTTG